METGFSTPLLDVFRRGEADRELRMLAAQGAVAPRPHEQLALLMLLVSDPDQEVAATAEATLSSMPRSVVADMLARSDITTEVRAFFAARGVEAAANPAGADESAAQAGSDDDAEPSADTRPVTQRLAEMTVAQRVVRAMKGSREERAILIRDSSKLVATAVLSSPKLTDTEVESIAKMANVQEEVLRIIGRTRAWVKSYAVAVALARNPKTPVALSMNLLSRLTDRDLKLISTDRNVPDVLRATARRKLVGEQ